MKEKHHKKTDLEELQEEYTREMQAAARIAAAQPGVDNEDRPKSRAALVEPRPERDY